MVTRVKRNFIFRFLVYLEGGFQETKSYWKKYTRFYNCFQFGKQTLYNSPQNGTSIGTLRGNYVENKVIIHPENKS